MTVQAIVSPEQHLSDVSRKMTPLEAGGEMTDNADGEVRVGLIVAGVFFVLFLGWAAFVPLDAAAYAPGQLIVSGQRQTVQHRDGGVVWAIHVKEGQRVKKGELLIELVGAEVRAQESALGSQLAILEARRARLLAEQAGASSITWPAHFAAESGSMRAEIASAVRGESNEFAARRSLLAAQRRVLGQQSAQSSESASGFAAQMKSSTEQQRLIELELEGLRKVAKDGFVSQSRIRSLERAKAELGGQRGQYQSNVAQARVEAGSGHLRQIEAESTFREKASGELREVEFTLGDLLPKYRAAADQFKRLEIRAPVDGQVVGLKVFTIGGVISPGQPLLDIVPDKAALVISTRVSPDDADDLTVGQTTELRFSGLHDHSLPNLQGRLTRLSADSFVDEKTGMSFYTAEVSVQPDQLARMSIARGHGFAFRAGTPVQVLIPLHKRTALGYAFEPLAATMWRAFREH